MKLKINWGVGITIAIIVFTLISVYFIYFAYNQEVNLVRDDYYEAELSFNETFDAVKRTKQLKQELLVNVNEDNIVVSFPNEITDSLTGNILLYRPSDRNSDKLLNIKLGSSESELVIPNTLIRGLWKIQINWNVDSLEYFDEKTIMVN